MPMICNVAIQQKAFSDKNCCISFCIATDLHYLCILKTKFKQINNMQETRQNRIARLLQKELSLIFQSQTRAMHGIMVSVTRCRVSPDLSICTRYELGTRVRNQLRIIPELRFFIDDSLDYIERIDELLKK